MNTKVLMSASAIALGISGVAMSFMPDEILAWFGVGEIVQFERLLVQLAGAGYFGFAMVNWTARANLIGGIYSRPVAIGNFTHFIISALALVKGFFIAYDRAILGLAIVYVVFAILFGLVFFTHPVKSK